jgi:ankyrin repeat protein
MAGEASTTTIDHLNGVPNSDTNAGTHPNGSSHTETPSQDSQAPSDANSLPAETIAFAARMFNAAREGNEELLIAAVDAGIPVNMTNSEGNTLLMLSSYAGHASLVRSLLKRGADPNALNDKGQSILAGAVFKGHIDVIKALCDSVSGVETYPGPKPDAHIGTPNAIQAALMFHRTDVLEILKGSTSSTSSSTANTGSTSSTIPERKGIITETDIERTRAAILAMEPPSVGPGAPRRN